MSTILLALALHAVGSPHHAVREWGSTQLIRGGDGYWHAAYTAARSHPDPEVRRRCEAAHRQHAARFVERFPGTHLSETFAFNWDSPDRIDRVAFDAVCAVYPTYALSGGERYNMRLNLVGRYYWSVWGESFNPGRPVYPDADQPAFRIWATQTAVKLGPRSVPLVLGAHVSALVPTLKRSTPYYDGCP